jgi:hypothetical protein
MASELYTVLRNGAVLKTGLTYQQALNLINQSKVRDAMNHQVATYSLRVS